MISINSLRTVIFSSLLFLSASAFSQQDPNFHIYLMFGQSNMEGQGNIEGQDQVTNPRVKMLQDSTCPNLGRAYGVWYTATPPLNRCWGKLGPGDSFGRLMVANVPSNITIGLVNVSVSGCNIYIYKKGCPNGLDQYSQGIPFNCGYAWLLDLAKKAKQAGVIKGILFHQGETNTNDTNWKYTVQQIVNDLKTDLGLGDIPFLAGELLQSPGACCYTHNSEIALLPGLIPNCAVISSAGLTGNGIDNAHFGTTSYRTLGERYAQEMLKRVYNINTGITENEVTANSLELYPNPATNEILVKHKVALRSGQITNAMGQVVLTLNFIPSSSDYSVNINQLEAGTYYFKLISNEGVEVKKFVKMN